MHLLTRPLLNGYLRDDWVLERLLSGERPGDREFISHRWLLESPPKRLMYREIYGQLHSGKQQLKVLDVGGGFCSLSRDLVGKHDYRLLEINAHDSAARLRSEEASLGRQFWIDGDWESWAMTETYDVVVANDLFPNVDQRLELFLRKMLRVAGEVWLSLTYYNVPRFYRTRRVDGGQEILFMLAWDGAQTRSVLERFRTRISEPRMDILTRNGKSLFENGRQVCIARIQGTPRRKAR